MNNRAGPGMCPQPVRRTAPGRSEASPLRRLSTSAASLDVTSDPDHNRSVLTSAGHPQDAGRRSPQGGRRRPSAWSISTGTGGSTPEPGAVDVVPFYPVQDGSMDDARLPLR